MPRLALPSVPEEGGEEEERKTERERKRTTERKEEREEVRPITVTPLHYGLPAPPRYIPTLQHHITPHYT
jgi:hypothetical protein